MYKKLITIGISISLLFAVSANAKMVLKSDDMVNKGKLSNNQVYSGFGCEGKNISPHLSWSGAPADTKSYAIMAYDPDAPTGSGWWHWVMFNIPATTNEIPNGFDVSNFAGNANYENIIQGKTDYGTYGFGGACPPVGDRAHNYIFTVYALKTDKLPLDKDNSAAMVGFMVRANAIDSAKITVKYGR